MDAQIESVHTQTYLSTEFIIARKLKRASRSLARSLARVAQRMLVINTFRPLSHACSPFFRASNFRSFRRGHTLVGETLTSDLCLRRARRERKKSERESAAKMTDLVGELRLPSVTRGSSNRESVHLFARDPRDMRGRGISRGNLTGIFSKNSRIAFRIAKAIDIVRFSVVLVEGKE